MEQISWQMAILGAIFGLTSAALNVTYAVKHDSVFRWLNLLNGLVGFYVGTVYVSMLLGYVDIVLGGAAYLRPAMVVLLALTLTDPIIHWGERDGRSDLDRLVDRHWQLDSSSGDPKETE